MSNYVKTTNFLRKDSLPDTDTDKIIRGSEFDTEFNNLVTAVASKANTVSPELTGVPRAPTADAGTNSTQIATTAFVSQNAILTGMIVMWSGAIATIPTGYVLCDGDNATPDLRDKFIVGAGSTYDVEATGGSTDTILPSHTHTATSSVTDPCHTHTLTSYCRPGASGLGAGQSGNWSGTKVSTSTKTGISVATAVGTTGEEVENKNLPPYFALAFIMKT